MAGEVKSGAKEIETINNKRYVKLKFYNNMRKIFMFLVVLLAIAAAAIGPVRAEQVTFSVSDLKSTLPTDNSNVEVPYVWSLSSHQVTVTIARKDGTPGTLAIGNVATLTDYTFTVSVPTGGSLDGITITTNPASQKANASSNIGTYDNGTWSAGEGGVTSVTFLPTGTFRLTQISVDYTPAPETLVQSSTSSLEFGAKCYGSGTANDGVQWTVTSDGTESTFDNTKGIHYGTNSAQVQYIELSTSGITGTITQVKVNASTNSGVTATVGVTVGGNAFGGDPQGISNTATDYTFTGSASGAIVVRVAKPSAAPKALYVKSIEVTYTPASGGGSGSETQQEPSTPHTVRFASGNDGWTVQDVTASSSATAPAVLENVMAGDSLVVTAPATLPGKVKSVKAVKYVPPAP